MQRHLFPDVLNRTDCFGRNREHISRGHGVWSIASHSRALSVGREERRLVVMYDDERYAGIKTGKPWSVELRHYLFIHVTVETGWGKSKISRPSIHMRYRSSERRFASRDDAVEFAERLNYVFEHIKAASA